MFFLLQNQRKEGQNRFCGDVGVALVGGGGDWERGRRMDMVQKCVYMYVNAKKIPVETVLRTRQRGRGREVEGNNSSMMYLVYCKNLVNATMYPYSAQ
jgi:hypothetical protein